VQLCNDVEIVAESSADVIHRDLQQIIGVESPVLRLAAAQIVRLFVNA
jgi:hypothetical protein